ncbi:hypothetical protein BN59_01822 [Legionella massiliensis]|uniref:Protein kinase domain-containing protein n=1 Tax=Legionella massiliensis TaxID=1034943 RepID=A0A078L0G6_9GAMM|nr:hypothetical protein [Legionella massiliensis]CDZ77539.1 hypothetical protein BN59_01822 [Legionella massiliensis]CEE13277.1 hypothetical protein BN1094_01822 [Legionella massiliensis]
MAYCKKFIDGINLINFADDSVRLIRNSLIAFVYHELMEEERTIKAELTVLPKFPPDIPLVQEQFEHYQTKQSEKLAQINDQLEAIRLQAEREAIDLINPSVIDEEFISKFAANFRNLRHLSDTLSDAPPQIKALQTRLYTEVLFKLDQAEQETQLATLSLANIQDMIEQALNLYETQGNEQARNQCHKLVHMGIYELIRRECELIQAVNSQEADYLRYEDLIRSINAKLPKVGKSSILDNLSQYRNTQGQSIGSLLAEVEEKLQIKQSTDWDKAEKISAMVQKKALLDKLRFGQEDRREYAQKTQQNLARDLFWARNIRDVELFTKSRVSDQVFSGLAEKRHFSSHHEFEVEPGNYATESTRFVRLGNALDAVLKERKEKNLFPLGNRVNKLESAPHIERALELINSCLDEKFSTPRVRISPQGQIIVDLYYLSPSPDLAQNLLDGIIGLGGFGNSARTLLQSLMKDSKISQALNSTTLVANSLDEIAEQLEGLDLPLVQKEAYRRELEQASLAVKLKEIASLRLDNANELLLRKILELRAVASIPGFDIPPSIRAAFKALAAGKYSDVLKIAGDYELDIEQAYRQLAHIDERGLEDQARAIVAKAKVLGLSSIERQEKLQSLQSVFAADSDVHTKAEQLSGIFLHEYHNMVETLGLTHNDYERLHHDIQVMAQEMVRLIERTKKGEPALMEEEQTAYFSAVQQIAAAIAPVTMAEVKFKISYSAHAQQNVRVFFENGDSRDVLVDLQGVKLPYSLIKPPGASEFIFSYGGSRGVIAPFAGLDSAYAGEGKKKGRMFTHSRLLGVGQYGSVKEVESLLTGLNQVIKKGYVPSGEPTFIEASRNDLRTRPLTSRDDPLYRIESDVLQNLSKAAKSAKPDASAGTQYWIEKDKLRKAGRLYTKDGTPEQYQILTERAKGETLADTANRTLNQFTKAEIAYHNPLQREAESWAEFKNMLGLAQAVVEEAEHNQLLGFSHNDIKPENFLYKQNADGSYQVRYIDWATGGFSSLYQGENRAADRIFAELFGADLPVHSVENLCFDDNGRFVRIEGAKITYGVNPSLQILHGARNGTLPYISPKVLGEDRSLVAAEGGVIDTSKDTKLHSNEPYMDDWALTSMIFGICNRQAYFALIKGRAVSDYIVPGILEADGQIPLGLKVVNTKKFNDFFACQDEFANDENLQNGSFYRKQDAVMYIPANQREGEPLHLYRRLQHLQQILEKADKTIDSPEGQILRQVNLVLTQVYNAVASGEGLNKQQLKEVLHQAQQCIKNYEKLNDLGYQQNLAQGDILQALINEDLHGTNFSANDLLQITDGRSRLEILCTYPNSVLQKEQAIAILDKAFNEDEFNDKFIENDPPSRILLQQALARGQKEIVLALLAKISKENPEFIALIKADGLLHYSAEQGLNEVFTGLIDALKKAGASEEEIFKLMLVEYGPGPERINGLPYIKWASNCLHIAIRNNNSELLTAILSQLPASNGYEPIIHQALHFSALLSNKQFFLQILEKYNSLHADNPLAFEQILAIKLPPDGLSPYQLFLRDESASELIPWDFLKNNPELARVFLASQPALIAAEYGNFPALSQLIKLGQDIHLEPEEWQQFFRQTDANSKNLLNHILEQGQLEYLAKFITLLKESTGLDSADILVYLLSNSQPVNPLRNFLNSETNSRQQFAVIGQLLDSICPHFAEATAKQQEARLVALLVNQEWLVEQAENPHSHLALRALLQNEALSLTFKRLLFERLAAHAQRLPLASKFYTALVREVSPALQQELEPQAQLAISAVFKEVSRQSNDLNGLVDALMSDHGLIKEQEIKIRALDSEVEEYRSQLKTLRIDLQGAQRSFSQASSELEQTREELIAARLDAKNREREITALKLIHKEEEDRLEQQIRLAGDKGQEALENAVRAFNDERRKNEVEINRLEEELEAVQSQSELLDIKLKQQESDIENKLLSIQSLTLKLEELNEKNNSLAEKLELEVSGLKADKLELAEKLIEAERLDREARGLFETELQKKEEVLNWAREEVQKTLVALNLAREENETLVAKTKAQELQVDSLGSQVKQLIESQQRLNEELSEERQRVQEALHQVEGTKELLATANQEVTSLQRKAEEVLDSTIKKQDLLDTRLKEQAELLQSSEVKTKDLESSLSSLSEKNVRLTEELRTNDRVGTEAREKLEEQLQEQLKTISVAREETGQTLSQLKLAREENTRLAAKAKELEAKGDNLALQVDDLNGQVRRLTEAQHKLSEELESERARVNETRLQAKETNRSLAAANEEIDRLQTSAKEATATHQEQVRVLEEKVSLGKKEASEALAQEKEEHQRTLAKLQKLLEEANETQRRLDSTLQEQGRALQNSEEKTQVLERQLTSLTERNEQLSQELQENQRLGIEARAKLEEQLDAQRNAAVKSQQAVEETLGELGKARKENEALVTKTKELEIAGEKLGLQVDSLGIEVEQLTSSQQRLTEELGEERSKVQEAIRQVAGTNELLDQANKEVLSLQRKAEETLESHHQRVANFEEELRAGKKEAEESLLKEQEEHNRALAALRVELDAATEGQDQLAIKLQEQAEVLQRSEENTRDLENRLGVLNEQNLRLTEDLQTNNRLGSEAIAKLKEQLQEQQKAAEEAQSEVESTLSTLTRVQEENLVLVNQAKELAGRSEGFQQQIIELTQEVQVLRSEKVQLAQERRAIEEERARLREEKLALDAERLRLTQTLALVAQEKAITALKKEIKICSWELLDAISWVSSNNELLNIGLNNDHVKALYEADAYEQLVDAAELRLAKFSQEALVTLLEEVQLSNNLPMLWKLERINSNNELHDKGLDKKLIDALQGDDVYKEIKAAAEARLDELENEAITALKKRVKESTDIVQLNEVAKASSNEDLAILGLPDVLDALNDDSYEELAELASERLEAEREAFEELRELVTRTSDRGLLQAISRVRSNAGLEAIGLDADLVQSLINPQSYRDLAELARDRINDFVKEDRRGLAKERHRLTEVVHDERSPRLMAQRKAVAALKAEIAISKDDELLQDVIAAESNEELIEAGLRPKLVNALVTEDAYLLIVDAAEKRYAYLLEQRELKQALFMSEDDYQDALDEERAELAEIYQTLNKIVKLDGSVREDLKTLGSVSPVHWFNPGFQSAAKKHASEMGQYYEKLALGCAVIIDYLRPLRHELKDQLASLPTEAEWKTLANGSQKKAIKDRRELLTRYLQRVEKELEIHEPLDKKFHGDPKATNPLLRQGILKTIKQAKVNASDLQFMTFASDYDDHPVEQKSKHFEKTYAPTMTDRRRATTVGGATALITPGAPATYRTVDSLKKGKVREHTLNEGKAYSGRLIEERPASFQIGEHRSPEGITEHVPGLRVTASKFPTMADPNDPKLIAARVEFSIAMASLVLASLSEPPTEKNPLVLRGVDPEEIRYVWTALVHLGKELPHMKFDYKAIKVISAQFNPQVELQRNFGFTGSYYTFNDKSCFEKRFKNQPALEHFMKGIKEASDDKLGHKEGRERLKKSLTKAGSTFFKSETQDVIAELHGLNKLKRPPGVH